jgi:hypothetical protein
VVLPTTPRRLVLADAVAVGDPGSLLSTPATQTGAAGPDGASIRLSVTGGESTTDPFSSAVGSAGAWIVWEATDPAGDHLPPGWRGSIALQLMVRTAPGASSDANVGLFLASNIDPTDSALDGFGCGLRYTGGGDPQSIVSRVPNGATSITAAGGGAGIVGITAAPGPLAADTLQMGRASTLTSALAEVTSTTSLSSIALSTPPVGWYNVLMVWRSATTAGTAVIDVDPYVTRELGHGLAA